MSKYYYPMKKLVYSGERKREISMPVGGIGTGCIGLASNGALVDFNILKRTKNPTHNGFALFAVKSEVEGEICDIRALETDAITTFNGNARMPTEYFCSGEGLLENSDKPGIFPRFTESDFISSYPFGEIDFQHENFPGKIHLTAWNPLIPLNDTDSGIPSVFLEYRITNDTDKCVDYTFYGILQNPCSSSENSFCDTRNENIKYIKLTSSDGELYDQGKCDMCIGVLGNNIKYQEYLLRNDNTDSIQNLLNDIKDGDLVNRRCNPDNNKKDSCVISSKVSLLPGSTDVIRFIVSWYTPYSKDLLNIISKETSEANIVVSFKENHYSVMDDNYDKGAWKNYYTRYFTGADECVYYCLSQWERLYEETDMYRQLLFSSTLPADVIEAVSESVAALKSPFCVRIRDGSLYTLGENGKTKESFAGLWNYDYAHFYLFPGVERSVLTNHYKNDMNAMGTLSLEAKLPNVHIRDDKTLPCIDAQLTDVLRVYREFKLSGKTEWLSCIWKDIVKSIEFAWHPGNDLKWDPDKTGIISGNQYHSYSSEIVGENSWICGLYTSALKAASELAAVVKDKKHTELFNSLYEKGREFLNTELCNGKHFLQKSDKLYSCDLSDSGDPEKIKYLIYENLLIRHINRKWQADIPGLSDEGIEIIRKMNDRYDGSMRNPFRMPEKVIDSTRSFAAYVLLETFSGQSVDVYNKSYRFCPNMRFAEKGVYRCMVCFDNFLGYIERGIDYIQLNCLRGSIKVRKIEVPDIPLKVKCSNIEIGFDAEGNTAILDNDCEVNPSRDLFVIFKIND